VPGSFGDHIKRLRDVRRLTQDELAERSGLAADTIRRLEHQDFSPSLRTLRKVCKGLDISLSGMFNSFELDHLPAQISHITTLLIGRPEAELRLVEHMVEQLLAALDDYRKVE
jgi:transcriptional regulator with XRE-family HTH domain